MSDFLIVFAAKYLIAIPVLALLAYIVFARGKVVGRLLWLSVVSLPIAYLIDRMVGALYYDPRPFVTGHFTPLVAHAADNGFPSDHTLFAATIAMIVLYADKRAGVILWILAIIIGIARVFAGVHHITDIIASIVIAALAVPLSQYLIVSFGKIKRRYF